VCSIFWLFWLSCQYFPSDWLERLIRGSLTVARGSSHKAQAEECFCFSWFSVKFHCFMMYLCCPPPLHDIFHTLMVRYSLFVLKVPLNTKQLTYLIQLMNFMRDIWEKKTILVGFFIISFYGSVYTLQGPSITPFYHCTLFCYEGHAHWKV